MKKTSSQKPRGTVPLKRINKRSRIKRKISMANILKCNNDDGLHFLYLFCKWKEAEVENIWGAV
jgi:hypothetical protein